MHEKGNLKTETSLYVEKKLSAFNRDYIKTNKPVQVSFREICSNWRWAKRSDVYTHAMHRYPARLFPYIPIFFLSNSTFATEDDTVLDPFAGSGTVLLESIVHPFIKRNCYGVEINPLARLIAKVKTTPLETCLLEEKARNLFKQLESFSEKIFIPEFKNRDMWFSPTVQKELAKIKVCIERLDEDDYKDFFLVCFSSIIRKVSLADRSIPPPVLIKPEKFRNNPERYTRIKNLFDQKYNSHPILEFKNTVKKNIKRMGALSGVEDVFLGNTKSEIIWDDARELKHCKIKTRGRLDKKNARDIKKNSIGLVITSPPYISAQKYVRTTRLEMLWLGLLKEDNLPIVDRNTIGTERVSKNQESIADVGIAEIDTMGLNIYKKNRERGSIFLKYFHDMRTVFHRLNDVLKSDGKIVMVIGNNKILGKTIKSFELIGKIAGKENFNLKGVLVDKIRSRGFLTKRHETGGLITEEYILIIEKES